MSGETQNLLKCIETNELKAVGLFSRWFCGPKCQFTAEVKKLLSTTATVPSAANEFATVLDRLDDWFRELGARQGDPTTLDRWMGMSNVVRARLKLVDEEEQVDLVRQAKKHFDDFWSTASKAFITDWAPADGTDASAAEHADRSTFATYGGALSPWTPGSWMTWDVMTELSALSTGEASETTNVLFGMVGGEVMQLAVELLPGPARVVTPSWWKLGLTVLPTGDPERYFLGAVERALTLAAPAGPYRLRWHLEAPSEKAWWSALTGRSVEAAAASAVIMALELMDEIKQQKGTGKKLDPIADSQAAVTAVIDEQQHPLPNDPLLRSLKAVSVETLPNKLAAAKEHHIDRVVIAAGQSMTGVGVPASIQIERAATLGEAVDLLRGVNRAIDKYLEFIRTSFPYYEEETPAAT